MKEITQPKETYPREILLYKEFTIQPGTLVSSKHSFKNCFRQTEQLLTSVLH